MSPRTCSEVIQDVVAARPPLRAGAPHKVRVKGASVVFNGVVGEDVNYSGRERAAKHLGCALAAVRALSLLKDNDHPGQFEPVHEAIAEVAVQTADLADQVTDRHREGIIAIFRDRYADGGADDKRAVTGKLEVELRNLVRKALADSAVRSVEEGWDAVGVATDLALLSPDEVWARIDLDAFMQQRRRRQRGLNASGHPTYEAAVQLLDENDSALRTMLARAGFHDEDVQQAALLKTIEKWRTSTRWDVVELSRAWVAACVRNAAGDVVRVRTHGPVPFEFIGEVADDRSSDPSESAGFITAGWFRQRPSLGLPPVKVGDELVDPSTIAHDALASFFEELQVGPVAWVDLNEPAVVSRVLRDHLIRTFEAIGLSTARATAYARAHVPPVRRRRDS